MPKSGQGTYHVMLGRGFPCISHLRVIVSPKSARLSLNRVRIFGPLLSIGDNSEKIFLYSVSVHVYPHVAIIKLVIYIELYTSRSKYTKQGVLYTHLGAWLTVYVLVLNSSVIFVQCTNESRVF